MVEIISTEELKKLIDEKGDYVLIDVRESEELDNGMIPTAQHIPLGNVIDGLSKFDKKDNIIFHCRTGVRSEKAAQFALGLGFVNAKNFKGSIWEWSEIDPNVKRYGAEPF